MSANIVDLRPDRFLRAMRETGNWIAACEQSGLDSNEIEKLCRKDEKFDLAQLECQLQYHEEQIIEATEQAIKQAREQRRARIQKMREDALEEFKKRRASIG